MLRQETDSNKLDARQTRKMFLCTMKRHSVTQLLTLSCYRGGTGGHNLNVLFPAGFHPALLILGVFVGCQKCFNLEFCTRRKKIQR